MARPLDQFGGWLRFFFITAWIGMVLKVVIAVFLFIDLFTDIPPLEKGRIAIVILEVAIFTFLIFRIVKIVPHKDLTVPTHIVRLLFMLILIALVFAAVEAIVLYAVSGAQGLTDFYETGKEVLRTLLWCGIWSSYFMKSKRVMAFYGGVASDPLKVGAR